MKSHSKVIKHDGMELDEEKVAVALRLMQIADERYMDVDFETMSLVPIMVGPRTYDEGDSSNKENWDD